MGSRDRRLNDARGPAVSDRRFGTIFILCPFGSRLYRMFFGRPVFGIGEGFKEEDSVFTSVILNVRFWN